MNPILKKKMSETVKEYVKGGYWLICAKCKGDLVISDRKKEWSVVCPTCERTSVKKPIIYPNWHGKRVGVFVRNKE